MVFPTTDCFMIGLHISFLSTSVLPIALSLLSAAFPNPSFPLLVAAPVLDASGGRAVTPLVDGQQFLDMLSHHLPAAAPVLGWATHAGLDSVWGRVRADGVLKPFQQVRLVGLTAELYQDPAAIPAQEVRWLELLHTRLQRRHPATFTELVVAQLLAAIAANGEFTFVNDSAFSYLVYQSC